MPTTQERVGSDIRVLPDGGGMRGLASLCIVQELLVMIRQKEQERDEIMNGSNGEASTANMRELPLACHYFSFMFGTSTGGIIAIMLGRLRMDIEKCIEVYQNLGTQIFAKKQPLYFLGQDKYDYKKLEKFIKETARHQSRLPTRQDDQDGPWMHDPSVLNKNEWTEGDRIRNRFVPCRVGVLAVQSHTHQKIHMFRSYYNGTPPNTDQDRNLLRVSLNDQKNERIFEVARATSAAPYYFRSMKVSGLKYLDGGLIANNPSNYAWTEANLLHGDHPSGPCPSGQSEGGVRFLVSIGTGKRAEEQIKSGKVRKALSIINKGVQSLTDPEADHLLMKAKIANNNIYYRFNVETGLEDMKLDDCRIGQSGHNITFHKIQDAVLRYLRDGTVRRRLGDLAEQLVDNRRQKCRQQDQGYHNLCTPGPLQNKFDTRFDHGDGNGNVFNSPVNTARSRTGSAHRPANDAHEQHTPVPDMSSSASMSGLDPQSPPQSPNIRNDTPAMQQGGFSTIGPPKPQSPSS
ncbi:FabD/lysophospholipase-like protein, partial [Aureobasidium melanogenum]